MTHKNTLNRSQFSITVFIMRLIPSIVFMSFLFYGIGASYVKLLIPLIQYEMKWIHPEYQFIQFSYDIQNNTEKLILQISINRYCVDGQGRTGNVRQVQFSVCGSMIYIHPIIMFSFIFAWPGMRLVKRIGACCIAIPFLLIVQMLDTPILLICLAENNLVIFEYSGLIRQFWCYILSHGGRQFLSLIGCIFSILPFYLKMPTSSNQ